MDNPNDFSHSKFHQLFNPEQLEIVKQEFERKCFESNIWPESDLGHWEDMFSPVGLSSREISSIEPSTGTTPKQPKRKVTKRRGTYLKSSLRKYNQEHLLPLLQNEFNNPKKKYDAKREIWEKIEKKFKV